MAAYDDEFFATYDDGVVKSADAIVPLLLDLVGPRSVIDIGCGIGTWLSVFLRHGVTDIHGVDGPWVGEAALHIPRTCFRQHDLEKPVNLGRRFDLVTSFEVAEHLAPSAAESFVRTLTALGDVVAFSAAIPDQGGVEHVNEQWPSYWAERFQELDYVAIDGVRPRVWHNADIWWWYRQNLLIYVRRSCLARYPKLLDAATEMPLSLVHPELFAKTCRRLADTAQHVRNLEGELQSARSRCAMLDGVGPSGLRLARGLRGLSRRLPAVAGAAKYLARLATRGFHGYR
ncbi:MAG: class I SAM-dependent methyltransferase [Gemmataceae bacterium]|nr:class I SAM-dependent methyltransferase [Gemmataceae bacterium]